MKFIPVKLVNEVGRNIKPILKLCYNDFSICCDNNNYSYDGFYSAARKIGCGDADFFLASNGKIYVPATNYLFRYGENAICENGEIMIDGQTYSVEGFK